MPHQNQNQNQNPVTRNSQAKGDSGREPHIGQPQPLHYARQLPYEGPLNMVTMFKYFSRRAIGGVEQVDLENSTYRRSVRVDGQMGIIEIQALSDGRLEWGSSFNQSQPSEAIEARVRAIFGLDQPIVEAHQLLGSDQFLGPIVAMHSGLRVAGTWDPFETGVRTIMGQQVSVAGASTIAARFVERLGTRMDRVGDCVDTLGADCPQYLFPTPATVAEANLDAIGMPQARVNAIRGFANAVAEGQVVLDKAVPLDELISSICAIKGLGPWTAHYIAMRLGHHDAFPAADLGLRKALATTGDDGVSNVPNTRQLEARSEAWRPWRSLAAMLLWHHNSQP